MAGLSIQRTNEINSLSAELLADKGIIKSERGPNNARVVDQQQVLAEMEKRADQIAASSGGKVTAQEVKDAAKNIRDAAQQAGSDVNNATAFLRLLQGNALLANRSLSEMNQSGEIKTLAQQQRHNPVEFRNALGAQYPDMASLQTAMGKVSAGLPDMTSAAGSRLPDSVYAPGTIGGITSRVGSAVGGGSGLKERAIDVGISILGARAFSEIGGGSTQKYMGVLGGVLLPEVVGNMRSGQGLGTAIMNVGVTGRDGILARAIGGYIGGELTGKGNNSIERALGVGAGSQIGTDIVTNVGSRLLGGLFGGGRGSSVDYRTPGFGDGIGMNRDFNRHSGYHVSSHMDPNVAGVMAMHALRESGYGFTGNQIGSGGAGVAMATMQENPVYRALYPSH